MEMAKSKVTAQGQISIPAAVRRKLGIGPGSVLQWQEEEGKIVVSRVERYTSLDVHKAGFPDVPPKPKSLKELKEGISQYIIEKHARR